LNEFPERLRKLRDRKHIKRYVLSERCGLHSDAIRRYERGEAKPDYDSLIAIADELDTSLDYLTGRDGYIKF
jgi:transcriptional regulator with XRE-family HTH domain